eukprot:2215855-Pleurochrysis_carterae.AAC.2
MEIGELSRNHVCEVWAIKAIEKWSMIAYCVASPSTLPSRSGSLLQSLLHMQQAVAAITVACKASYFRSALIHRAKRGREHPESRSFHALGGINSTHERTNAP